MTRESLGPCPLWARGLPDRQTLRGARHVRERPTRTLAWDCAHQRTLIVHVKSFIIKCVPIDRPPAVTWFPAPSSHPRQLMSDDEDEGEGEGDRAADAAASRHG